MPYQCVLQPNGKDYAFTTDELISYEAYFSDGAGYFPDTSFAEQASMFNLILAKNSPVPYRLDARVMVTATELIASRFAGNKEAIICYVCDPKDGRQQQRATRFDRSFAQGNVAKELLKIDILSASLYGAVIYHRDNPAGREIEQAATDLLNKF